MSTLLLNPAHPEEPNETVLALGGVIDYYVTKLAKFASAEKWPLHYYGDPFMVLPATVVVCGANTGTKIIIKFALLYHTNSTGCPTLRTPNAGVH